MYESPKNMQMLGIDPFSGRPKGTTDPEKDQLKNRVGQLERQVRLFEQRDTLRTLLKQMEEPDPTGSSTKKNSK